MEVDDSRLHSHLNKLVDDRLEKKRQQIEGSWDGLNTYYQTTVFGDVTLTDGVGYA